MRLKPECVKSLNGLFLTCVVFRVPAHVSLLNLSGCVSVQRTVRNNEVYQMKTSARVIVNKVKMNSVIPHLHMLLSVLWRGQILLKVSRTVRYQAPAILFNYLPFPVSVGVFLITVGLRRNENVRLKLK